MSFYVTWVAGVVMATTGIASMWVFSRSPRLSARLALVQVAAGLVVIANEALRPGWSMLGIWLMVVASTFGNWYIAERADRRHHRNMTEALEVLAELERMHRQRARLMDRPPKEC